MLNTGCPDFCKILARAETTQKPHFIASSCLNWLETRKQAEKNVPLTHVSTKQTAFKEAVPPPGCPQERDPLPAWRRPSPASGPGTRVWASLYGLERPPNHRPRGAKSEGKGGGVCAGKAIFSLGTGTGTGTGLAGQARGPAALCWLPPRPGLAPGGLRAPRTPSDPRWAPVGLEEPLSLCRGSLWPR